MAVTLSTILPYYLFLVLSKLLRKLEAQGRGYQP